METVSNIASQASSYLFGGSGSQDTAAQSGQEPRSGETGDVALGEPYDAGNKDEPGVDTTGTLNAYPSDGSSNNNFSNTNSGGETLDVSKQETQRDLHPKDDVSTGTATGPNVDPATTGDTPGNVTSVDNSHSDRYANKIDSTPTGDTSTSQPRNDRPSNATGNTADSVVGDPSSGNQPTQKQQGADRPGEAPTGDQDDAVKEKKKDAEDAQNVDTSAPGPRPIEEVAKENGGDAAGATGAGGAAGGKGSDDNGDKPQSESHGEGTGEKYVKSSGMKADGGDFDAANAGAGKEADRLLEEKGVHHGADAQDDENRDASPDSGSGDKGEKRTKLKDKIKAKLHKH